MLFFFNPSFFFAILSHSLRIMVIGIVLYNIFRAYSRKDYLSDGRQIVFEISLISFCVIFRNSSLLLSPQSHNTSIIGIYLRRLQQIRLKFLLLSFFFYTNLHISLLHVNEFRIVLSKILSCDIGRMY